MVESDIKISSFDKFKDIFGPLGNKCTTKVFKNDHEKFFKMCCNKQKQSDLRQKRCSFIKQLNFINQNSPKLAGQNFWEKQLELTKIRETYDRTGNIKDYIDSMYKLYNSGIPLLLKYQFFHDLRSYTDNVDFDKQDELKIKYLETMEKQSNGGTRKRHRERKTRKAKRGGRKWSLKYKRTINCNRPRGFSQKQYCKYGRRK